MNPHDSQKHNQENHGQRETGSFHFSTGSSGTRTQRYLFSRLFLCWCGRTSDTCGVIVPGGVGTARCARSTRPAITKRQGRIVQAEEARSAVGVINRRPGPAERLQAFPDERDRTGNRTGDNYRCTPRKTSDPKQNISPIKPRCHHQRIDQHADTR